MNRAYKLVWNTAQQAWTVASELAKGKTKSSGKSLKTALVLVAGMSAAGVQAAPAVNALPTGESVASGSATFDRSVTNQLIVNQSSSKLISNWNSFDVGSSAAVQFVQPDAASIALNRVTSASPTQIFGQVTANGQLVIVNPNGISFGAGSQVSAASIIGSVLDIQDSDFNSGNLLFNRGSATGGIDNQGSLTATAGSVSLLAPSVKNSGVMRATGGSTNLINADGVNLSTLDPAITTASSIAGLIKNSGSLHATQLSSVGGKILLQGDTSQASSKLELTGTLTAEESSVNAQQINVAGVLDVDGTNNTLKLSSTTPYNVTFGSKINLNGAISGFSVNGTAYTVIRDVNQLQAMSSNLAGKYVLANDVDASDTVNWNAGAGFVPVGNSIVPFSGALDGLGHEVKGLVINRPTTDYVGMIGFAINSSIQNIALKNSGVTGRDYVGALSGQHSVDGLGAYITNSAVSGSVSGRDGVGGLVGAHISYTGVSTIGSTHSLATVSGRDYVGGLTGINSSHINNSYATGNVTGQNHVGGLVGGSAPYDEPAVVSNSYANGAVNGSNNVGGLVGSNAPILTTSVISDTYATGQVIGLTKVGGLTGLNTTGAIINSYWDVDTTGQASAVGTNNTGTLTNLIAVSGNGGGNPSAYAQNSYTNFNFNNAWFMANGASRPMLRAFLNNPDSDGKIAVSNLYQLQGMTANLAGSYYLTQDINASATAASVAAGNAGNRADVWGGRGFAPVGSAASRFTGLLNGLGHGIDDLNINRPATDNVGLFGYLHNSTVQNVGLTDNTVIGHDFVGGLAGVHHVDTESSISNSYVTGNVVGRSYVGGLLGYQYAGSGATASTSNSYASGNVTGQAFYSGGLVGLNKSDNGIASISNSYATGDVAGNDGVGGLVGGNYADIVGGTASIGNSYASGNVSGASNVGGLLGYNFGAVATTVSISNSYWDADTTGQAYAIGTNNGGSLNNLIAVYGNSANTPSAYSQSSYANFDFNNTWFMANGAGRPMLRAFLNTPDSDGKIGISNLYQLQGMITNLAGNYYLAQDIDAGATAASVAAGNLSSPNRSDVWGGRGFVPVGNSVAKFTGSLDGLGHSIDGLSINRPTTEYIGLLGYAQNSSLHNIGLSNVNVQGAGYVGGLVAYLGTDIGRSLMVSNNHVSGSVTVYGNASGYGFVGGLVGYVYGYENTSLLISNNLAAVNLNNLATSFSQATGGLVGYILNWNGMATNISLSDSETSGTVSGSRLVGGLVGEFYSNSNTGNIINSRSSATVTATGTNGSGIGGLVGSGNNISNSYATGTVSGSNSVGGLAGSGANISNSYATGMVSGSFTVGGLTGYGNNISNSYATGAVSGINSVGGLVGQADSNISSSYATGAVSGNSKVGGLVGYGHTNISNSYSTSEVSGIDNVGGLVGLLESYNTSFPAVNQSHATGTVNGSTSVGGLVGFADNRNGRVVISNSHAIGAVTGINKVGGLVGEGATINGSYASGNVSAVNYAGGLVGYAPGNNLLSNSYATGDVVVSELGAGGLVGYSLSGYQINNTYATGDVSAIGLAGGLVGILDAANSTSNSYASGQVTVEEGNYAGGLIGFSNLSLLRNSYWNVDSTGQSQAIGMNLGAVSGVTGLSNSQMKNLGSFTKWGSAINAQGGGSTVWRIYDGYSAPLLRSFLTPLTATVADATKTYDATTQINSSFSLSDPLAVLSGTAIYNSASRNAGIHALGLSGLYSDQQGYDLSINNGSVTINKASLTISSSDVIKTYDGKTTAAGTAIAVAGTQLFGSDSLTGGTFSFNYKHAGTGKTVTTAAVSVNDGNGGNNYNVSYADNTSSTINKALLTISAVAASKVYDGKLTATGKPVVTGRGYGDTVVSLTQSFANKHAGTGKTVKVNPGFVIRDGNNGNNYDVVLVDNQDGVITPKALTISTVANSKVYDGGVTSANKPVVSGLVAGDLISGLYQQYETKLVGENKKMLIKAGYVIKDGNNGGNYNVVEQTSNDGVITAH